VTPAGPITTGTDGCGNVDGAADVSFMYRTWIGGAGANGGQHEDRLVADPGYPTYKWVRLQRQGNVFRGYASADGVNWQPAVSQDTAGWVKPINGVPTPFDASALLGLAASRHGCTVSGTDTAQTEYRGFQLTLPNSYGYADVTSPGDPLTGSSGNHPGGETPAMVIDNNSGTKYLNFDIVNTGFTVTPTKGPNLLVTGFPSPRPTTLPTATRRR